MMTTRHDPEVRKSRTFIGAGSRAATWLLALAAATAGCGGGSGAVAPSLLNLQAQVSDPAGDALRSPLLPVSPDLVSARLETSGGSLRLSARFAPGTFDVGTTIVAFGLDTDLNPSTGLPGLDEDADPALGVDYMIIVDLTAPNSGAIFSCPTRTFSGCTIVVRPSATAVTDGVDLAVPLLTLGADDGRLAFKLLTWGDVTVGGTRTSTIGTDNMPNLGMPAGRLE